ncbi:MAG: metal-dependent hydrolase [Nevskiaceae bacterium]|nr:MAG: metal-dependent hydrolase [Nevskiaceae bacterium]TBR73351.1 MAG: metal-dependent hydrolase [Nevskiaceae bacterium]
MAEAYSDVRGFRTLLAKEIRRFVSVIGQTVTAPVVTALLYLVVFAQALRGQPSSYPDVSYTQFLVPGLIMMSVLQNAFANTSSSLTQSKFMGNLVFVLMAPLSTLEIFGAYVLAALLRAALVVVVLIAATWPFVHLVIERPLALIAMFLLAGGTLAALGMIGGIVATKFDHLAAFQNFVVMPLSFLSGVFYSIHSLPPFWEQVSRFNPFFYLIDGFRYGFFGVGDAPILHSLLWGLGCFLLVSTVCITMLKTGYKLRA